MKKVKEGSDRASVCSGKNGPHWKIRRRESRNNNYNIVLKNNKFSNNYKEKEGWFGGGKDLGQFS